MGYLIVILSLFSAVSTIKVSPNCSQPLGMEDRRISDSQISASSSYQYDIVGPHKESQLYNFSRKMFDKSNFLLAVLKPANKSEHMHIYVLVCVHQ